MVGQGGSMDIKMFSLIYSPSEEREKAEKFVEKVESFCEGCGCSEKPEYHFNTFEITNRIKTHVVAIVRYKKNS
ncbi:MAG: hypothetical protein V1851_03020 [Patescibacteria group bacterium]